MEKINEQAVSTIDMSQDEVISLIDFSESDDFRYLIKLHNFLCKGHTGITKELIQSQLLHNFIHYGDSESVGGGIDFSIYKRGVRLTNYPIISSVDTIDGYNRIRVDAPLTVKIIGLKDQERRRIKSEMQKVFKEANNYLPNSIDPDEK